jgi:hypothetical protein
MAEGESAAMILPSSGKKGATSAIVAVDSLFRKV